MRKLVSLLAAAALVAGGLTALAASQTGPDGARGYQATARQEMQAGREMAPREIERRIIPQMRGSDYLGFEYDERASACRFKFLKEGQVTWVDVDARTGRVLRVSR